MEEIWKWVPGYEGRFEASDKGSVRSYVKSAKRPETPHVLNPYKGQFYARLVLSYRTHLVHRLIALTFIPNPLGLPEVNHKDGDRFNNAVENLEWVTRQQNAKHGFDNGLLKQIVAKGGRGYTHKLTDQQVLEIRARYAAKEMGAHRLGKLYGVSKPAIFAIVKRRTWAHI